MLVYKLKVAGVAVVAALATAAPAMGETYGASTINTPAGQRSVCPQAFGLEVWPNPGAPTTQKLIGMRVKKDCAGATQYHVVGTCNAKLYKNNALISNVTGSSNPTCNLRSPGDLFSFVPWQGVSRTTIGLQAGYSFAAAPGSYLTVQDAGTQTQCTVSPDRKNKTCYFYDTDGVLVSG